MSFNKRSILQNIVINAYQLRELGVISGLNDRNFIPLCIAFGVDVGSSELTALRLRPFTISDFDKVALTSGYTWDEMSAISENYCKKKRRAISTSYVKDEIDDCICDVVFELLALAAEKLTAIDSTAARLNAHNLSWSLH